MTPKHRPGRWAQGSARLGTTQDPSLSERVADINPLYR